MGEERYDERVLGLTGGLATGASTVAGMLTECGALMVDADEIVHWLEGPATSVTLAIAERFGPEALDADERVDRAWLGPRVLKTLRLCEIWKRSFTLRWWLKAAAESNRSGPPTLMRSSSTTRLC